MAISSFQNGGRSHRLWRFVFAVAAASVCAVAWAARLDEVAVGRFGAGRQITPNTASQDLLAWNVLCDGKDFELRVYDSKVRPISLGACGLVAVPDATTRCAVSGIHWTGLTCRMSSLDEEVTIRESLLTPVIWFRTNGSAIRLFRPLPGRAVPHPYAFDVPISGAGVASVLSYEAAGHGRLARPWFIAYVKSGDQEIPVLAILRHNPDQVAPLSDGGIAVHWAKPGNDIGLLPLNGSTAVAGVVDRSRRMRALMARRADELAERFLWEPTGVRETYKVTPKGVAITDSLSFEPATDDWGWSKRTKGYAVVPPAVSNAERYGYPVTYDHTVHDIGYPTFSSSLTLAPDAQAITFTLPRPDLYGTIVAPAADTQLNAVLAPEVAKTIRDYSQYVIETYKGVPGYVFDNSAIGEGRAMTAEYLCYRMMSPEARKVFDVWADKAAKDRIFNRAGFYGYGNDAASPRRFLIDKYRLSGNDYMDAGWFGYDVATMWERAFFADRWQDVRDNWPWIREMFYGWNWVYADYAVGYSPLYADAANGGPAKGYTDNMGMLPAMYAWARMADKMHDKHTLADALYMLARDCVGRYNRMTAYDYSRKCGYDAESVFTVSDQGNGPNLSPSKGYVPPDSKKWLAGPVVDYGGYGQGLWFLTGSFLEPPSIETLDLVLSGEGMSRRIAAAYSLIDERYPRWWAAPAVAETANYQIFIRGALLHENPTRLRYYFDYQDGLGAGVWGANAFHPYAFLGIALSPYEVLESSKLLGVERLAAGRWVPNRDEVQVDLLFGRDGRPYLAVWNATSKTQTVRIRAELGSRRRMHEGQGGGAPGPRASSRASGIEPGARLSSRASGGAGPDGGRNTALEGGGQIVVTMPYEPVKFTLRPGFTLKPYGTVAESGGGLAVGTPEVRSGAERTDCSGADRLIQSWPRRCHMRDRAGRPVRP